MKKLGFILQIVLFALILTGCDLLGPSEKITVTSIEITAANTVFDGNFVLSDLTVQATRSDGSKITTPLTQAMISAEDLAKFSQEGTHTISATYEGQTTSFEITIRGEKGDDGRQVTFRVEGGFIQWQYVGDTTWTNLIATSSLVGPAGPAGPAGETGATGPAGETGATGPAGETGPAGQDGKDGEDGKDGVDGINGIDGIDGKPIQLQVSATHIQWRYEGDATWQDLIALSALAGADGKDGVDGADGKDGVDGADGKDGVDGATPTITISVNGFWVINGIETEFKAVPDVVVEEFDVTFDVNGGELPQGFNAVQTVVKSNPIVLPVPTKENHIFLGWFTGTTVNDGQFFNYMPVTQDMTLMAKWQLDTAVIHYDVRFLLPGGITHLEQSVVENGFINEPTPPTRDGYVFLGWAEKIPTGSLAVFPYQVTESIDFFSLWEEEPSALENLFFARVKSQDATTLVVEVVAGGDLEMCGYDMRLFYDNAKLTYKSRVLGLPGTIANTTIPGEIRFNYSDPEQNIVVETVLLTVTFDIVGTGNAVFDVTTVEVIALDANGYDLNVVPTNTLGLTVDLG